MYLSIQTSLKRVACAMPLLLTSAYADGPFYGDPPDATHPWAIHDMNRPLPPIVTGATPSTQEHAGMPPSDAVVLFDGTEKTLGNWEADKSPAQPTAWIVKDGTLQCVPGSGQVRTKQAFADCQLHVEWSAPSEVHGNSQGRGNSGIFLMGTLEVQVLDNYNNPTYADGYASSIYGVNPPMANALRAPGEWQVYDIIFRPPVYDGDTVLDPGYITVFVNGVLTQDHTPLEGGTGHRSRSKVGPFPKEGPLKLQDHGNPVRYRNIWYRPLPKRVVDGGDGSQMPEARTTAKRAEIAAGIREDATSKEGHDKMYRLMESLCYAKNEAALKQSQEMVAAYVAELKAVPANQLDAKKGEIMRLNEALRYMRRFNLGEFSGLDTISGIIKAQEWDK